MAAPDNFQLATTAIQNGNLHLFQDIPDKLEHQERLYFFKAKDTQGNILLHAAVSAKRVEITKVILDAVSGLSTVRSTCGKVKHVLRLAKEWQNEPNVVMLLEQRDNEGRTPLHICALQRDAEMLRLLLHSVGSTQTLEDLLLIRDKQNFSVLHSAAKVGYVKVIQNLFSFATNLNIGMLLVENKKDEQTPLHCAISHGNMELFKYLLSLLSKEQAEQIICGTFANQLKMPKLVECALSGCTWQSLDNLSNVLDLCYTRHAQTTFFKIKDENGNTLLHHMGYRYCLVEEIVKLILRYIDVADRATIIRSMNNIGHTVLHTFVYIREGALLISAVFGKDRVENMIQCLNTFSNEGTSALWRVALTVAPYSRRTPDELGAKLGAFFSRFDLGDAMIMLLFYFQHSVHASKFLEVVFSCYFSKLPKSVPADHHKHIDKFKDLIGRLYRSEKGENNEPTILRILDILTLVLHTGLFIRSFI